MYIIGSYLSSKGLLEKNTIVTTVMSNLGFHKALDAKEFKKKSQLSETAGRRNAQVWLQSWW